MSLQPYKEFVTYKESIVSVYQMIETFFKQYLEIFFKHFEPELLVKIIGFLLMGLKEELQVKAQCCNALKDFASFLYGQSNKIFPDQELVSRI